MKISEDKLLVLFGHYTKENEPNMLYYRRVYSVLREAITNNDLPNNCELPATRKVSEILKLSRSTIIKAYELLRIEGYLKSKIGSGYTVSYEQPIQERKKTRKKGQHPSLSELAKSFEKNKNLVNNLDDNYISFRPGLPPLDIFPIAQWKHLTNRYWQLIRSSDLRYQSPNGLDTLRISLVNYLNISRSIKCDTNQLFIVGGSLQSLFLIGSLILNPNDEVAIEENTFPNVNSVFKGLRGKILPVPTDKEGMTLERVKTSRNLKLVHTTPACQYPLGIQMSAKRRKDILELASSKKTYIIENDYEHEINNSVNPQNPIFSLDDENRTFYLGTFNRILHPSIRLAYMVIPKHLVGPMERLMRHSHMSLTPAVQLTMRNFIENKFFQHHLIKLKKTVEKRKAFFKSALNQLKNPLCKPEFLALPSLHMLIRLHPDLRDTQVVEHLKAKGIIVHALSKCTVSANKQNGLIVGFASSQNKQFQPKLKTLIAVLDQS